MNSRICLLILIMVSFMSIQANGQSDAINSMLESIRKEYGVPALAAAFLKDGKIAAVGVAGLRKHGVPDPVLLEDKFHIGSNTKAMTAMLAAMLVEEKKLSWTNTLEDIFPEFSKTIVPQYKTVTLELFLGHRGGAPDHGKLMSSPAGLPLRNQSGPLPAQRLHFIKTVTSNTPEAAPGTKYIYSNPGYVIAGAMIEKVTGKGWEEVIVQRLFTPLKMNSAGFGAPGTKGKIDQPWGHVERDGKIVPIDHADNLPVFGPAGTVHCTITDLARFALAHLEGAKGNSKLLKRESFEKLHTALPGQEYALGWVVTKRGWAGGKTLTHSGSNTMWYSVIWLGLPNNIGVVVCANIGGPKGEKASDAAAAALLKHFKAL